jgi:hypothetical protein
MIPPLPAHTASDLQLEMTGMNEYISGINFLGFSACKEYFLSDTYSTELTKLKLPLSSVLILVREVQ